MAYPYRRENKIEDVIYYTDEDGERREAVKTIRDSAYGRDVGTLDSYWNSNMDMTGVNPYFNMYGRH
jgi:glucose-1-phosphate adenylyltransferase